MFLKNKEFAKVVEKIVLLLFFVISSFAPVSAQEVQTTDLGIVYHVNYDDLKRNATINFDFSGMDETKFKVVEFLNENEKPIEIVDELASVDVHENKEYLFKVLYKKNRANQTTNSEEMTLRVNVDEIENDMSSFSASPLLDPGWDDGYYFNQFNEATNASLGDVNLTFSSTGVIQLYMKGVKYFSGTGVTPVARLGSFGVFNLLTTTSKFVVDYARPDSSHLVMRYTYNDTIRIYYNFTIYEDGVNLKCKISNLTNTSISGGFILSLGGKLAYAGLSTCKTISNFDDRVAVAYLNPSYRALSFSILSQDSKMIGFVGVGPDSAITNVVTTGGILSSEHCTTSSSSIGAGGMFQFISLYPLNAKSSFESIGRMSFLSSGQIQSSGKEQNRSITSINPNAGYTSESNEKGAVNFILVNVGTTSKAISGNATTKNGSEIFCGTADNKTNNFTTKPIEAGSYLSYPIYARANSTVDFLETIDITSPDLSEKISDYYLISRSDYTLNAKIVEQNGNKLGKNNLIKIKKSESNSSVSGSLDTTGSINSTSLINQMYRKTKVEWSIDSNYVVKSITFNGETLTNDTREYEFQGFEGLSLDSTGKKIKSTYDLVVTVEAMPPIVGDLLEVNQETFELPYSASTTISQKSLLIGFTSELLRWTISSDTKSDAYISDSAKENGTWKQNGTLPSEAIKVNIVSGNAKTGTVDHAKFDLTKTYYLHVRNQEGVVRTTILDLESGVKDVKQEVIYSNDGTNTKIPINLKETTKTDSGYKASGISEVGFSFTNEDPSALNDMSKLLDYRTYENVESTTYEITITGEMRLMMNKDNLNTIYIFVKDKVGNISQIPMIVSDSLISVSFPSSVKVVAYRGYEQGVIAPKLRITNYGSLSIDAYIQSVSADEKNTLKLVGNKVNYDDDMIGLKIIASKNFDFAERFLSDCNHFFIGAIDGINSDMNYGEMSFDGLYSENIMSNVQGKYYLKYYFCIN